ncbi:hypothetical protein MKX01_014720, partial [Papaver californicum]
LENGYEADYVPVEHSLLYNALRDNDTETTIEYIKNDPQAIGKGLVYDKSKTL